MASDERTLAVGFDEAQERDDLEGVEFSSFHHNEVPQAGEIALKSRFMCYPQGAMRAWELFSKEGPTVVLCLLIPGELDLDKLHCALQLIGPSETKSVNFSRFTSGFVEPVPLKEGDPEAPQGQARVMVYWPGRLTGIRSFHGDREGVMERDYSLRVAVTYGDQPDFNEVVFIKRGPKFKVTQNMSTVVLKHWSGMGKSS